MNHNAKPEVRNGIRNFLHDKTQSNRFRCWLLKRSLLGSYSMMRLGARSADAGSVSSDERGFLSQPAVASPEKSGWLQKWTNYIKGYRQRWFVLDSEGVLSYYRNQAEVGVACRGSVNLKESRIHSDSASNSINISGTSQSFHLKANNEIDRNNWLNALEYARHRACKKQDLDDEDNNVVPTLEDMDTMVDNIKTVMMKKLEELKVFKKDIGDTQKELEQLLSDIDNERVYNLLRTFKEQTEALVQKSEELVDLNKEGTNNFYRFFTNEHDQRCQLQDQIETLAKQHSNLENAAFLNPSSTGTTQQQKSPYDDSDDEEFHDAPEEPEFEVNTNEDTEDLHNSDMSSGISNGLEDTDTASHSSSQFSRKVPSSGFVSMTNDEGAVTPFAFPKSIKSRRSIVPTRPQCSVNLWSIMKNCIGKELTKIPMPVNFNEPLSVLQRITEDLEYADLLDTAANCTDPAEQMCYVAAYATSCYSTTGNRTTKPFNPLLGETYECDRTADRGWWSITEQVSHHPPATAHHAEGRQWTMFQEFNMTSRFRGKYLSVTPTGFTHIKFKNSKNHYTYRKITTTVHNIIVGKLWIDNHGEMNIENHFTKDKGVVKFHAYSYFSPDKARKVSGLVKDGSGNPKFALQGYWDKYIEMAKVNKSDKNSIGTGVFQRLWTVNPPFANSETMHNFTQLAIELNEPEEGVAPTDSRLRPDQRLMEDGQWDEANEEKEKLEERQRTKRKIREQEAEQAMRQGKAYPEYEPSWFEKTQDECTGSVIHVYKNEYWSCKEKQDWAKSKEIF
ncbi:unnamed protein product [Bursaphelenchus okinawaensis]|uniref:Oxysterol-binding protein n=1 Tax=Bursaphelenchus okinawaensis TaxID=465554 RepID=A0A811KJ30_9BILA|nr:unnamed protein product [Bursaphelenchus okinawaensis]CAG9103854.1 unnamed protein product [Bursaphelenchus okinawaensis]